MIIRQAKSGDVKEIAKIHLETNSEETYVAEIDMQIVGFLTIGPCCDDGFDQNTTGEIWGIYLDPNYWRKGIGRSLCEWAESTLSTRGYKQIAL